MTTSTPIGIMRRSLRPIYWATQLAGWGLYIGFFLLLSYLDGSYEPTKLRGWVLVFAIGVGISHAMRAVIVRNQWLDHSVGFTLPRLMLSALLLGVSAFIVEGAVHDLLFPADGSHFTGAPLDLLGNVINWTLLLFIWSFAYFAYIYFIRHRRDEIRNLRLETANRDNQLNALRAQMNPHFMFNALNGIRALIDENPEQAKRAITQLSAILRNAMATVKRKTVPLGEEVDIVKAYLALEAMRFEERIRVHFDVDASLEREPVPPMLVQTLVENAVRHGIAKLPQGGDLYIAAHRGLDHLVVSVKNTGHYEPGHISGTGIGLRNTRKRLEMLYGTNARLAITNQDGMVITEVEIPLRSTRETQPSTGG
ncbi:MAG: histidine kinase [Flavobacteriales bacterium]